MEQFTSQNQKCSLAGQFQELVNRANRHQRSRPIQSLLLINRLLTFPVPDNQFLVISTVTFKLRSVLTVVYPVMGLGSDSHNPPPKPVNIGSLLRFVGSLY